MRRWVWFLGALFILASVSGWWLANHHAEPRPSSEDPAIAKQLNNADEIARGRYLATVGDCISCHTSQGGVAYAGGRMLATPFGNIPSPNLTPDVETGLGRWNFHDFWRALHSGIGHDGELLYPAFSYTSFTKVTRADALAIYAYLRSLPPAHQPTPPLELRFPYKLRSTLAAWRALYFQPGIYQADPAKPATWNRGAYLVQGLGHCNECHAARGAWGELDLRMPLSGGRIPVQDWYAPDLSMQANGGLQGWSKQDIVDLLKTGQSPRGAAFGPMADVVASSTQYLHDDDLQAIAEYLQSLPARHKPLPLDTSIENQSVIERGGAIYAKRCVNCHGENGAGVAGVYPPLDSNVGVTEPTGINATRAVLLGGFSPVTVEIPRPYSMPPYAQQLNDTDVAAVVTYIRQAWSNHAPAVMERDVAKYRHTPLD